MLVMVKTMYSPKEQFDWEISSKYFSSDRLSAGISTRNLSTPISVTQF